MLSHTLLTYGVGPVEEASGSGVLGLASRLCGLVLSKPRCGCCRLDYCCLSLASSINSLWISRRVVWRASILLAKSSILLLLSSILFAVVGRYHVSILYWRCRSINTTASERIVTGRRCALVVLPVEKRL
jgi:hypothetical protein